MSLEKIDIGIPFAEGIDDKIDPKLLPPGKLRDLQHAQFSKGGAIKKRPGFDNISKSILSGGTVSSADGVHGLDDQVILFANGKVYSRTQASDAWAERGTQRIIDIDFEPIGYSTEMGSFHDEEFGVFSCDTCVVGNYLVFGHIIAPESTYSPDAGAYVSIKDLTSGAWIYSAFVLTPVAGAVHSYYSRIRVIPNGTKLLILTGVNSLSRIELFTWNTSTPQTAPVFVNYAPSITPAGWDACFVTSTFATLVYHTNATTLNVVAYKVDSTGFVGPVVIYAGTGVDTIRDILDVVALDGTHAQVVFTSGGAAGNTYVLEYAPHVPAFTHSATVLTAGVRCEKATGIADGTNIHWFYQLDGANQYANEVRAVLVNNAGVISAAPLSPLTHGAVLGSRPIVIGGNNHILCYSPDAQDPYVALISELGHVVARAYAGNAGVVLTVASTTFKRHILPTWVTVNSIPRIPVVTERSIEKWAYEFMAVNTTASSLQPKAIQYKNSLIMTGGVPLLYDGANAVPLGFIQPPRLRATAQINTGGSMSDGIYSIVAIFEYTDAFGRVHRSAPSAPLSHTLNLGGSTQRILVYVHRSSAPGDSSFITGTMSGPNAFAMPSIRTVFYRTLNAGTTYYRYGYPDFGGTDYAWLAKSDADIQDNEVLYTLGGELANIAPPAVNTAVVHRDRVILDVGNNELWISKPTPDGFGVAFSNDESMLMDADVGTGKVTSLASMDGRLIVFTENGIHYRDGEPPNSQGIGGMTQPRNISTPVGAVRGSPIAVTSIGVFFISKRGIELLDRSLNVIPHFGAAVEDQVTGNITSSVVIQDQNEVRFTSDTGDMIVYNYHFNQWSTYPNIQAVGATLWNNTYVLCKTDGTTWKENQLNFDDAGTSYVFSLRTAWFRPKDIQGYFRAYWIGLVGEYKAAHTFTIDMYVDYDESTIVETKTLVVSSNPAPLQIRFKPARQKVEALQLVIKDTSPTGTEESFSLSHMQVQVGLKPGIFRQAPTATL